MKIDRLFGITIYLLNHGKCSAKKLSRHFEVSERTVMRDMDTLCMAGIPVISTFGTGGGYEIDPNYVMKGQLSNQKDYSNIVMALQGLATAYQNQDVEATLEKIKSLSNPGDSGMQLDLSVAREEKNINELLDRINQAINTKQVIEFTYHNTAGEEKIIKAEPIYTIYKWYHWYLIAYSRKHEDYRMYKLLRIEELKVLSVPYSRQHDAEIVRQHIEQQPDSRAMIHIRLHCDQCVKLKFREYLNGTVTKEYPDGSFEYEMTVPENEQFWYGILLSLGSQIYILEPDCLKQRMMNDCKCILQKYKEDLPAI